MDLFSAASGDDVGTRGVGPTGPLVEHALIPDGDWLWLAVRGAPAGARLALDRADHGVALLVDDAGHDAPAGWVAARCRLDDVLPAEPGHADVVLVGADGGKPLEVAVRDGALAGGPRSRIPVSSDGRWQHAFGDRGGTLTVRRQEARRALDVLRVAEEPDAIVVDVVAPGDHPPSAAATLRLLRQDDRSPVGEVTGEQLDAGAAVWRFRVRAEHLPHEPGVRLLPHWTGAGTPLPLRRHHHDLRDANGSVHRARLAPVTLPGRDGPTPVARVWFGPAGGLEVRTKRPGGAAS